LCYALHPPWGYHSREGVVLVAAAVVVAVIAAASRQNNSKISQYST
jgi:hypothetical protein